MALLDCMPAPGSFSVTRNTFVLYSSNVFAILGLRALYGVLARTIAELRYLHYGLGAVLRFAGFKLMAGQWLRVSALLSVGVIGACLAVATWASLRARRQAGNARRGGSRSRAASQPGDAR